MKKLTLLMILLSIAGCSTYNVKMLNGLTLERLKTGKSEYLLKVEENNSKGQDCSPQLPYYLSFGLIPVECESKLLIVNSSNENETYEALVHVHYGLIKKNDWPRGGSYEGMKVLFDMVREANSHNKLVNLTPGGAGH